VSEIASLLVDTALRGELHHAVILYGPSPDALRAAAVAVAKALNCVNGSGGDDCTACARIDRRSHPDVHFVEVAGDKKLISVEQIREVVGGATMRPYEGRNKVFIIDPADALSPGGSNSLLKTLEEPARDTHFILLTRSYDLLLPTIKSRSQQIYVGGDVEINEALAADIVAALVAFSENRDSAALLGVAAMVAGEENVSEGVAVLARVLCDAVAGRVPLRIDRARLLAAADAAMAAARWLQVNADPRMLVEQALAELVA
jgi:hypothetical protein